LTSDQNEESRFLLYKRPDVRLLLDYTINGHEKILPSLTEEGYTYPEVNRLLKVADSSTLLEELTSHRLYIQTTVYVEVACPGCASRRTIHDSYACPFCKSPSLKRGTLLEHYKCGHVDLMQEFTQGDNLVCPKCRGVLRLIGTDYSKIQDTFRCEQCNRSFVAPSIIHRCLQCKNKFSYETARLWPVYAYEFNEIHRLEVISNCAVQLPLVNFLKDTGFIVQSPGFLNGQSGIEQDFDIVASRDGKNYVFMIGTNVREVNQDIVATMFAKRFDVEVERSIVVAIPRMNREGLKMAEMYGIDIIQGEEHRKIAEGIQRLLQLAQKNEATTPRARPSYVAPQHTESRQPLNMVAQEPKSQPTKLTQTQSDPEAPVARSTKIENEPLSAILAKHREEIGLVAPGTQQRPTHSILKSNPNPAAPSVALRCTYCNRTLIQSSKFCDQCGRIIA
jgi:hypothetical protein